MLCKGFEVQTYQVSQLKFICGWPIHNAYYNIIVQYYVSLLAAQILILAKRCLPLYISTLEQMQSASTRSTLYNKETQHTSHFICNDHTAAATSTDLMFWKLKRALKRQVTGISIDEVHALLRLRDQICSNLCRFVWKVALPSKLSSFLGVHVSDFHSLEQLPRRDGC